MTNIRQRLARASITTKQRNAPSARRTYPSISIGINADGSKMTISEFLVTLALAISIDEGKAQFQKLKKKFKEITHSSNTHSLVESGL